MITVFVGDNTEYIANEAIKFDSNSYLLDYSNYQEFLDSTTQATIYTSVADLPSTDAGQTPVLYKILLKADEIVYIEPSEWSDKDSKLNYIFGEKYYTESILTVINNIKHNVKNLVDTESKYTLLEGKRINDNKQLWVLGCSITAGVGVDVDERYGHFLEKELKINTTIIARAGMSIPWNADQLLRSDIREGDTVFWAMPHELRTPVWSSEREKVIDKYIFDSNKKKQSINDTDIETIIYHSISNVMQVVDVCRKLNINLIICPINPLDRVVSMMKGLKELFLLPLEKQMSSNYLDVGTDNMHPGPIQHSAWAKIFVEEIKKRGYA